MSGKIILLPGAVLALGLLGSGAKAERSDSAILERLVMAYFDGVADKNFLRLDSVVTLDFAIYEDGKVWNNDSVFRNIQFHEPFEVKFTLTQFRIFADERSGDARYHERADFVILDTVRFTLNFIESAVFRKTAAGWKISLIHVTAEKPPVVTKPAYYRKLDSARYIPEYYRKRIEAFRLEPIRRNETIMLGNSLTEFGNWRQLLADSSAVNRGIAGDNTFGMLERLPEVIARRPERLFIEAGINDIGQGVPVGLIVGNIRSIVQYVRVKSPGTRVYVVSVLPTNEFAGKAYPQLAGKNEVVREVDRRLQDMAASTAYAYIDVANLVTDRTGNLDKRYARADGVHLNAEGYTAWVSLMGGHRAIAKAKEDAKGPHSCWRVARRSKFE